MKDACASEWFDVSVTVDGKKYAGRFQIIRAVCSKVFFQLPTPGTAGQ